MLIIGLFYFDQININVVDFHGDMVPEFGGNFFKSETSSLLQISNRENTQEELQ